MSDLNGAAPQNLDAEQSVLGAVLLSDTALPALIADERLQPEDFYRDAHGIVYAAMLALHGRGSPVDALTLVEQLKQSGQLDAVGGRATIDVLVASVPAVGNLRQYARIVRENALAREALRATYELQQRIQAGDSAGAIEHAGLQLTDLATARAGRRVAVTAEEFIAQPRPPLRPLVTANDGRSVLLAAGTFLLVAGPSGTGKSLAAIDLAGLLASDDGGHWLGCKVTGGQRVLLVVLEGSEDDAHDRLDQLLPASARRRIVVDGHWANGFTAPTAPEAAQLVRQHDSDVLTIDTYPRWISDHYDLSRGIPEQAHDQIDQVRRLAGRDVATAATAHTRKIDRVAAAPLNELEEINGTFAKKVDSAIVIRRDGDGPRRKITFAKVRRGPEPPAKIAALPDVDSDAPPRLVVVADARHQPKAGNEPERIAAWIGEQDEPQTAGVITAALTISEDTLRRRRRGGELEALGIRYGELPRDGRGRAWAYGTLDQWKHALGYLPALDDPAFTPQSNPAEQPRACRVNTAQGEQTAQQSQRSPRTPATPHDAAQGEQTQAQSQKSNPARSIPLTGDSTAPRGAAPKDDQ